MRRSTHLLARKTGALALLLLALLVPAIAGEWFPLGDTVIGGHTDSHSDLGSTWWFYSWVDTAFAAGLPLHTSRISCLPAGESLANQFANPVDAILALPATRAWGAAQAANLLVVLAPLVNSLAAFLWLRATGAKPLPAAAGALLYGTHGAVLEEMGGGRPVTALQPWIPLTAAAWVAGMRTRRWGPALGWSVGAGLLTAVTLAAYAPWMLYLVGAGLGHALLRTARPAEGVHRGRAVVVLAVAAGVFWLASTGYRADLDARLASDAIENGIVQSLTAGGQDVARRLQEVQLRSLPFSWPVVHPEGTPGRTRSLPPLVLLATLAVLLRWPRKTAPWIATAVFAWLVTLGPVAMLDLGPRRQPLLVGGYQLQMPVGGLLQLLPGLGEHLRPERGSTLVAGLLGGALAHGLSTLGGEPRPDEQRPAWRRIASRAVMPLVCVLLLAVTSAQVAGRAEFRRTTLGIPDIYAQLDGPEDGILVELPVAVGPVFGARQSFHHRPLAVSVLSAPYDPSVECLHPFVRSLLAVDRGGRGPTEALLADAMDAGFSWILVHPGLYRAHCMADGCDAPARAALEALLGPADLVTADAIGWRLWNRGTDDRSMR